MRISGLGILKKVTYQSFAYLPNLYGHACDALEVIRHFLAMKMVLTEVSLTVRDRPVPT